MLIMAEILPNLSRKVEQILGGMTVIDNFESVGSVDVVDYGEIHVPCSPSSCPR